MSIAARLQSVLAEIRAAESRFNRPPNSVALLAVSKKKPVSAIQEAIAAGQTAFGENYLQEALEKITALKDENIQWHFIGAIQSNKTRAIAENFAWVHTVDRLKIAERLSEQRSVDLPPLNICLQVNIDDESSKSGVSFDELDQLVQSVSQLANIKLRGLMAIPKPSDDFDIQRASFEKLNSALKQYPNLDTLSIGMSQDLHAAIAAGSTMLRVGTAIFGPRG